MSKNEYSDDPEHPYYKLNNVKQSLNEFRDEYNARLKLLSTAYGKIYSILEDNTINVKILDNMEYLVRTEFNVIYQLFEKPIQFAIDIQLKPKKSEPYLTFAVKNPKTNYVIEEIMYIYQPETRLPQHFLLYFRNNFSSYYKN